MYSYAKIFSILYPPLENSSTRIAIIKGSRFNHSCSANAYFDWNSDKELEIRAMSKVIKAGQEITIDYNGMYLIDVYFESKFSWSHLNQKTNKVIFDFCPKIGQIKK